MTNVIRLSQPGGPDVLRLEPVDLPQPEANEVVVKQTAIGVNYLDVTQRRGDVAIKLPGGIGLEAAGTIIAKGAAVSGLDVGDKVVYALGPIGAYASGLIATKDSGVGFPIGGSCATFGDAHRDYI